MEELHQSERINGSSETNKTHREETLYGVLHRLIATIFFPDPKSSAASATLLNRVKISLSENGSSLGEASTHTGRSVLLWTRRGSPLRALLVISVGMITLLTMTGLLVFMLFFLAATVNAIIVSFFLSLAAAGGFLALFFACVTAIYIGALSVATFVIFTATVSAIIAVMVVTGWIGFFCVVWLATKKSVGLAKHSLSMTGSALSAYSLGQLARHRNEPDKALR